MTNPTGARPTVYDVSRNLYGVDPATGFARRPWDNVGVQYGLQTLNAGVISVKQFLDLNEFIGGYDNDANYVPNRTVGDLGALTRMQQGGAFLNGGGGLSTIPIIDGGAYNDTSAHHYAVYHFAVRERLRQANGDISNHVMWRGPAQNEPNWQAMVRWVEAIKADHSNFSQHDKVRVNKPADIVDGCWNTSTNPPTFIAETQIFSSQPTTQCTTLYPAYSLPRIVAGGPLALNNMKCQLKPVSMADYTVSFTTDELLRLRAHLPQRRVRLVQAGRQLHQSRHLAFLRPLARQPGLRCDPSIRQATRFAECGSLTSHGETKLGAAPAAPFLPPWCSDLRTAKSCRNAWMSRARSKQCAPNTSTISWHTRKPWSRSRTPSN